MKKGFTLIEILGVIILLSVLSLIAVLGVEKNIKDSKQKAYDIQITKIVDSAKLWAGENVFNLPENEGEYIFITLGQLKNEGFLKDEVLNPLNEKPFDNNLKIKIIVKNNNYTYEVVDES